jgi:murein DD-endopeptidase MepM/ murein hydrolase activator NlpD
MQQKHSYFFFVITVVVMFLAIFILSANRNIVVVEKVVSAKKKQPKMQATERLVIWVQQHLPHEDRIFAFSPKSTEMSVILYVTGENIVTIPAVPNRRKVSLDDTDPVVIVRKKDPLKPYKYSSTAQDFFGTPGARPNLKYRYTLPFEPGKAYKISQGYGGSTHLRGSEFEYAVDFALPENSLVYSARDGEVVMTQDQYDNDGGGKEHRLHCNSIVIKHQDGSYAYYSHLKHNAIFVRLGDRVRKNQLIALSGNTGQSTGPHLHFDVSYVDSVGRVISVPIEFETANGIIRAPVSGLVVSKAPVVVCSGRCK